MEKQEETSSLTPSSRSRHDKRDRDMRDETGKDPNENENAGDAADAEGPIDSSRNDVPTLPSNYKLLQFENDLEELEKEGDDESDSKMHCRNCYSKMWDRFPRCCALWMRVVIPMLILLCLGYLGGWALAKFEAPDEAYFNDEIMRARKVVRTTDWNATANLLVGLPVICFDDIMQDAGINGSELVMSEFDDPGFISNASSIELLEQHASTTAESVLYDVDTDNGNITISIGSVRVFFRELRERMVSCSNGAGLVGRLVSELTSSVELQTAFTSPTFDWIRCWNETEFGSIHTYTPTRQQVAAAWSQEEFYEKSWNQNFDYWYDLYLREAGLLDGNVTTMDMREAFEGALYQATGRGGCQANRAGTSWFFFTVMTTVGYGNQAPVTPSGRILVSTFGFLSILCFGAILANAGSILSVLFEDAVGRFNLKPLTRPLWSCLFWGLITALWTLFLASQAWLFWSNRLPPNEVPTLRDSQWFAFISTTTVGLGDFFLEPEVMFLQDTLLFSFIFLAAFTFFAAFLTSLSDFVLRSLFPDAGEVLKLRLQSSRFRMREMMDKVQEAIHGLPNPSERVKQDLPDADPLDEGPFGSSEAIVHLLGKYVKCKNRSVGVAQREEELLQELLARAKKERMQLQYMGTRPTIKHQSGLRNLSAGMDGDVETEAP